MVGRALTEQYPKVRVEAGKEVLRVEGLSKRGVCTDVSFSLRRGETLAVVGESGCGKSMTALALIDLVPRAATRRAPTGLKACSTRLVRP